MARRRRVLLPVVLAAAILPVAYPAAVGASAPAPVTLQSSPGTTPFPPSTPSNLVATEVRTTSVTLTWTASTPTCCAIAGYDVNYLRAHHDVAMTTSVGNVTTATITTGISPTAQYQFVVFARDVQGRRSSLSNFVTVVTPVSDTGADTTPPQAPTDLTASNVTGLGADLSWSPATDNVGVTGYQVYRFDGVFISTLLATVTGTAYPVPLSHGRNQFYVRARDAAGNLSIATNTITLYGSTTPTPPPPPTPPVPPTTPADPVSCRISYTTQSQWTGGFVAAVTIHNTGATTISGWTLTFAFPDDQRVANMWNATYAQSGEAVAARDVGWNKTVPPGGSVSFGFLGSWTGGNTSPTGFMVNDTVCATG
nr:cellulose binding domain-containing protein [Micromonospora sp. DSM 115978]